MGEIEAGSSKQTKGSKKTYVIIFVIFITLFLCIICSAFSAAFYMSFSSAWLGGSGCLYDDGSGFIEMADGNSFTNDSGITISCESGQLVFD